LIKQINDRSGKPIAILMHTAMGKGVDFMEGTHEWHGIAPNDEQLAKRAGTIAGDLGIIKIAITLCFGKLSMTDLVTSLRRNFVSSP
jgi:transketolase